MVCNNINEKQSVNHIMLGCMEAGEEHTPQKPHEPLCKAASHRVTLYSVGSHIGCMQSTVAVGWCLRGWHSCSDSSWEWRGGPRAGGRGPFWTLLALDAP